MKLFTLLCTALIILSCGEQATQQSAYINFYLGLVTKNGKAVSIKETIVSGDLIITGEQSSCDIQIGGSIIRIKERSRLEVTEAHIIGNAENTELSLASGKILCKPKKLLKSESFKVRTPTAVAAVRGTQFSVTTDANKTTQIKVFEGEVKIARRVKSLDKNIDDVLSKGSTINKEQTAIITEKDALEAEKAVDSAIAEGKDASAAIAASGKTLAVPKSQIDSFKPADFVDEKEIIDVNPKPDTTLADLAKAVKKPSGGSGRLLVSRYEAYVIVNGKIKWEGKLTAAALREKKLIYIAASNRIIAARKNGVIVWNIPLANNGKLRIKSNVLYVGTVKGEKRVSARSGKRL